MRWTVGLARVMAVVAMVGFAGASDAGATFPGRSGELMYSFSNPYGKVVDGSSGVEAFGSRMKVTRPIFECAYFFTTVGSCFTFDPAVTADGGRVAVVVGDIVDPSPKLSYRLVLVAANGSELRSIALERPAFDITWSPTSDRLLATHYGGPTGDRRDGPPRVVLIGADGRTLGLVAGDGASNADWAANGNIAYEQSGDVWITRLGGTPRQLTTGGGSSPSWHPNRRALAFVRGDRIWTIGADGTGARRLAEVKAANPAWSPDGRYIAFLRPAPDNNEGLWAMRADGRCPHAVLRAKGYLTYTSSFWRPLAHSHASRAYKFACLSRAEKRRLRKRCIRKPRSAERRCLAGLRRAAR